MVVFIIVLVMTMADLSESFLYEKARSHLLESARIKRLVAGDPPDFGNADLIATTIGIQAPTGVQDSRDIKDETARLSVEAIVSAAKLIAETFNSGGKLLLCGNGGSAADCQHMAAEFTSRLTKDFDRPALPAIALTTDTSFLTAYANDVDFDGVFGRQVEALGKVGDVLIAISTSGNSKNIIRAVQTARQAGVCVVTLSGFGGRLAELADVAISVPSSRTSHIQEAHLAIEHIICDLVEHILFKQPMSSASEAV